ncbi:hypothetical protein VNO77_27371 [Canavalia gladiata]|uniref:Uncharacterized protein n=1 Tax=Canavalia gladiata TaxID=3824 RepID=A0AAN9KYR2_CANGL
MRKNLRHKADVLHNNAHSRPKITVIINGVTSPYQGAHLERSKTVASQLHTRNLIKLTTFAVQNFQQTLEEEQKSQKRVSLCAGTDGKEDKKDHRHNVNRTSTM